MQQYEQIAEKIKEADGILIGASNGLSIAEGYNIFTLDSQVNMTRLAALPQAPHISQLVC